MTTGNAGSRINDLVMAEKWEEARTLVERELEKEPEDHWLLTQLGETYYEERDYKKALELLLKSREIVADCPLALWHLAGTLDALGYHAGAVRIYAWLLKSSKTAAADPCWESAAWSDALKTDCVYRIGLCFKHQGLKEKAAYCLRQYLALLARGAAGSYPVEQAMTELRGLGNTRPGAAASELRKVANRIQKKSGKAVRPGEPPRLNERRLRELQGA
jgi:tetratricopeptide (TPR) repeat protein